jgi:hypothetical protein
MSNVWTRYREMSFISKIVLFVVVIILLAGIGLLTGVSSSTNSPGVPAASAATQPGPCPGCPSNPVDPCVADPDWCLSQSVVVDENIVDAASIVLDTSILSPADVTAAASATSGLVAKCHGKVWRRRSIKQPITGFTYGWRQTAISWCYGSNGVITSTIGTGNDGAYSGGLWCYKDVSYGKAWWTVSHSEVKVWNTGVLYTCAKALPFTRTLNPMIFAHAGTKRRPYPYWNYGDPTKVYR